MTQITAFALDDAGLVEHFTAHGWVLTDEFGPDEVASISTWVDEVAATWGQDGGILHHREMTDDGPKLARSENFVPVHEGLRNLLTERLVITASKLLGEPAVLYKEKINYKMSGGAGFSPHQDAPAYRFVETHVSCMVAVDDADADNGCLEVVSARHAEVLPMDDDGCIRGDVVAALTWETVPVPAGTTLWFHSRTPHRSGANASDRPRRALYPTYNARRVGELRDAYYEQKFAEFNQDSGDGTKVQVSLVNDFQGRPV